MIQLQCERFQQAIEHPIVKVYCIFLFLDSNNGLDGINDIQTSSIRRLSLQSSPILPFRECQFVITSSGVYGIER